MKKSTAIYIFIMFVIFPLLFHDYYYDIQSFKYKIFMLLSWLFICIAGLYTILRFAKSKINIMMAFSRKYSLTDYGVMLMMGASIVSTLLSEYSVESMDGSAGRGMGMYFFLTVGVLYFLISRNIMNIKFIYICYAITCVLISLLAVLNFFDIDPFGFYHELSNYQSSFYLTTLGNTNYIGSYICLSLPLFIVLYCYEKDRKMQGFYWITVVFESMLLLVANADSGYLGIGIFFLVFLYIVLENATLCKRYLIMLITLFVTARLLGIASIIFTDYCRPFFTISNVLTRTDIGIWILFGLCISYYFLYVYMDEKKRWNAAVIKKIYRCIVGVIFCSIILYFFYMTFLYKGDKPNFIASYFQFNDNWGTGRGLAWRISIEAYQKLPLLQQLFGYGMDTTNLLFINTYQDMTYAVWDNAHNEYIQYILSGGIVFLASYLLTIISVQIKMWKYKKQEPLILAIFMCVFAYSIQAIVNINQPVTTPIFFILLAILESMWRELRREV